MAPKSKQFSERNDAIVIKGVHDVATDTSAEARKMEGKLDALVSLVTQLAANQKPASVARVCGIRSSNDHHTRVCPSSHQSGEDEHPEAYATNTYTANQKPASVARVCGIRSSNDHHTSVCHSSQQSGEDEHPEGYVANTYSRPPQQQRQARKLEGKLDALVSLVTQLTTNQKSTSVARVCGICSSNDHHTSVCPSSQESGVDEHPDASAANNYSSPPQQQRQGVHDVATDTSAEARKLEGKLDAFVSFVTQLATNQKPASIARVCGIRSSNDHHTSVCPSSRQSGVDGHPEAYAANTYSRPPHGVQDVATNTSPEARKLEGKLDALVSLVTQLAANQKPASFARVFGIRSSNENHTKICPSSQQSGVDELREGYVQFSARNDAIVIRGVHDVATDTSAEARKLEGRLDALVSLVTQLAANQEPASVARQTTTRAERQALDKEDGSQLLAIQSARNDAIVISGVHDVATNTSSEARKLEGKLDALVSLVTRLVRIEARLFCKSLRHPRDKALDKEDGSQLLASFGARNDAIVIRGVHVWLRIHLAEARKLEGKLDALVSLQSGVDEHLEAYALQIPIADHHKSRDKALDSEDGSQLLARVQSARNDAIVIRGVHVVATDTSAEARKLEGKLDALVSLQFSARNDAIVIRVVHDVATETSAEARKLEGKLDALVSLLTQLAPNQKPASVARICGIRSSNDHHTSVCPSSQQSGVDEHPEAYASNTYRRPPQQ
ncbi:hypothetical protein Fmac_015305 [Flemingia macrophylla]|uniref:Uncharacterized protein n=1 Tax=Flemingia macrophylla TaxID=520843 RepID=A0ABD1ME69_9FABA